MKRILTVLAALLVVGTLVLARVDARRMPQVVSGDDTLSVAFGDAKSVIGRAMVEKADDYFHGGLGREPRPSSLVPCPSSSDPWRWINGRIRAPQQHRHLQGRESVEMLPWLWASVKADPHNEEAWEEAWYTAAHVMKDAVVAARILDEGLLQNPRSARLYLTKGSSLYQLGKGDLTGAEVCFRRALSLAPQDSQTRAFAANYLADLEKRRKATSEPGR